MITMFCDANPWNNTVVELRKHWHDVITSFGKDLDTCTTKRTTTNQQRKQISFINKKNRCRSSSCKNVWKWHFLVPSSQEIANVLEQPSVYSQERVNNILLTFSGLQLPTVVSGIIIAQWIKRHQTSEIPTAAAPKYCFFLWSWRDNFPTGSEKYDSIWRHLFCEGVKGNQMMWVAETMWTGQHPMIFSENPRKARERNVRAETIGMKHLSVDLFREFEQITCFIILYLVVTEW